MPSSKRKKHQSDTSQDISFTELSNKLDALERRIEKTSNLNTQKLLNEFEQLQGIIHTLQADNDEMRNEISLLKQERTILVDEVQELRNVVNENKVKQNDLELYIRKNNLRIFGVKDKNKFERAEDTTKLVYDIIRRRLGMTQFEVNSIDKAHRVGVFRENADRAIIVRFISHSAAEHVLANRRMLKGTGLGIVEDLTAATLQRVRKVRDMDDVQQVWTKGGDIFAKNKNGVVTKVLPKESLQDIQKRLGQSKITAGRDKDEMNRPLDKRQPPSPHTSTPNTPAAAEKEGAAELEATPIQKRLQNLAQDFNNAETTPEGKAGTASDIKGPLDRWVTPKQK